ncbi:MAG: glycosyltransferase family 4 protein [Verrucomicrobia bacterium]|nr:glycosyltransferase family 4 protein [Verrucomicrobiota bacterium]MCH8513403.1 glycosyltransferase family 4 protein [Kiritimatiellia bacterium]
MNALTRLHIQLLRLQSRLQAPRRWNGARVRDGIRVDYGYDLVPGRDDILCGGLVKCQDLIPRFPSRRDAPNLLYLVSSALPHDAAEQIRACKRAGGVFVLNQNGVGYPAWHGPGWQTFNRPLSRAHEAADHVIYQSAFCQRAAEQWLTPRRGGHSILHNPVDCAVFTPADEPPPAGPVLLTAGTHQFQYRVEIALRTLAEVKSTLPEARLLLAGRHTWAANEEAARDELNRLAESLGVRESVTHLPAYRQEDAPDLMRGAHILLHTQVMDACPRLVAEALACGLPVAYQATGGTPELVPSGAGAGVTAQEDFETLTLPSPESMADAVREIWSDYPARRQNAREHTLRHLDLPAWLDAHADLFADLLGGPSQ